MTTRLTTTDVPARFLQSAFLTGSIPWRATSCDARISYGMYIPPSHYATDATDATRSKRLPIVVFVHGTGRNVAALTTDLVPFAEANACAILAPMFPVGLDGPNDYHSYKSLRSETVQSGLILLSILEEVARCWPGLDTDKVYMLGFSGGGQFCQRFLYIYPERLMAVSIGAPGRPTFLDEHKSWPTGVHDAVDIFGRAVNKEQIKRVPIHYVIGGSDNDIHGGCDFWDWLQMLKGEAIQTNQLPSYIHGRLDTARKLHQLWKEDGIESDLEVIEGVAHDGEKLRPYSLRFIEMQLSLQREE